MEITGALNALSQPSTFQSPLAGVKDLTLTNISTSTDSGIVGSEPLPTFTASSALTAAIPAGTLATMMQVDWYYRQDTPPAANTTLMVVNGSGSVRQWVVRADVGTLFIEGHDSTGAIVTSQSSSPLGVYGAGWQHVRFQMQNNAGDLQWLYEWFPALGGAGFFLGDTLVGGTYGQATTLSIPAQPGLAGMAFGHLNVQHDYNNGDNDNAARGWVGETPAERITRICAEENVPVTVTGS